MLDAMTHMSGLKDYLTKYFDALKINNKINPLNPEDFVKYIDDDVDKQGIFNYSNSGILLCGLSVKYLYNKNKKTNKTYNEILSVYLKNKISIVIMDNDGNSTDLLHLCLNIFN